MLRPTGMFDCTCTTHRVCPYAHAPLLAHALQMYINVYSQKNYTQVVTADQQGGVFVWHPGSGRLGSCFTSQHDGARVTTAAVDADGRRLATGVHAQLSSSQHWRC